MRAIFYQFLFYVVLFLATSIRPYDTPFLKASEFGFFAFYAIVATLINYWLLPRFYYKGKLYRFWAGIALLLLVTYLGEELVLEPLLVGGERAEHVSNVFYTLLGIVPTVFMMVGFKLVLDFAQKQREIEQLKYLVQEGELRFLKSQIHPHFLFNNLNNLYAYALEKSSKTPQLILELSAVLRYMLYDCQEEFVPISKEIDHLKGFIALNKMQIEDRGEVNFKIEGSNQNFRIAPLVLSTFIENAFKHSTSSQVKAISIDVKLSISSNGKLNFVCINSCTGQSNSASLSSGIGLTNVQKRLELLYPNKHQLEIQQNDNQFHVILELDLKEHE